MNVDDLDKLSKLIRFHCPQVLRNLTDEINSSVHDIERSKKEAQRILDEFGRWVADAVNGILCRKMPYAQLIVTRDSKKVKALSDYIEGDEIK